MKLRLIFVAIGKRAAGLRVLNKTVKLFCSLFILLSGTCPVRASEITHNPPEAIVSGSAVLIDAKNALVLFDKEAHKQDFPASITKVMTALLAVEYADGDFEQRVHFSDNAVFGIPRDSSHIAMDVDETLSLSDALTAMMLQSANEVAVAIGEHIDGTEEAFAAHMTRRAKELGAKDSNFINPNGLPDPEHYTSAYDMALIMKEAIKYDKFLQVISMQNYKLPPTEKQPEQRPLNNSNRMILPGQFYNDAVIGGKTGYTVEAGHTLVTYAKRGGIELICVILRGEKNSPYTDTQALLDYGFSLYDNSWSFHKDDYSDIVHINQNTAEIGTATVVPDRNLNLLLPWFVDTEKINETAVISDTLNEAASPGDTVGRLDFVYDDVTLGSVDLVAEEVNLVLSTQTQNDNKENLAAEENLKESAAQQSIFIVAAAVIIIAAAVIIFTVFIIKKRRNAPMKLKMLNFKSKY